MDSKDGIVFDTGPLSHFSKEGWLGILRFCVGSQRAVIPDTVVQELTRESHRLPHLATVLDCGWIEKAVLETNSEIEWFAQFSQFLVVGERNLGEAGVLAYAKANGFVAVIDDGPGRKAAQRFGVQCRGTLSLLCEALRSANLTLPLVSQVADDLLAGDYRLPFKPGGFQEWAVQNGLVPS